MSGIAAAVAGSAIIGSVTSRNASKRAASTAQNTTDQQLNYMAEQEAQAREDVNRLIPQATQSRLQGQQRAMDLLGQGAPMTMQAMQQGNVGAQDILAGSMPQIQNALMGGNVNYGFMQPRQINVNLEQLLSGVPDVFTPPQSPSQYEYNTPMPGPTTSPPPPSPLDIWRGNQAASGGGFTDVGSQNLTRIR